ncbi:Meiotic recombination protein REC8 like protein [Myotis davidii]|uniref:Meiotic recombination protein REC8 like protein n=1 Tax=Myotis davidii TaxID=225400 RepID=L5M430_MYODS|nr:Meiotic recombination protein REC8 like protein [Myotis davidii]
MFYYPNVLQRHTGCFSTIWLAATRGSRLVKREYLKVNVVKTCEEILRYVLVQVQPSQPGLPRPRFSLYLSAQLQIGVIRVYSQQCQYLVEDIQHILERLHRAQLQIRIDMVEAELPSLLLPNRLAMMETLEDAPDPFFGMMSVDPRLPSPFDIPQIRHLLEAVTPERVPEETPPEVPIEPGKPDRTLVTVLTPEAITLQEAEPIRMLQIDGERDLPEVSRRDLDLLIAEEDEAILLEEQGRPVQQLSKEEPRAPEVETIVPPLSPLALPQVEEAAEPLPGRVLAPEEVKPAVWEPEALLAAGWLPPELLAFWTRCAQPPPKALRRMPLEPEEEAAEREAAAEEERRKTETLSDIEVLREAQEPSGPLMLSSELSIEAAEEEKSRISLIPPEERWAWAEAEQPEPPVLPVVPELPEVPMEMPLELPPEAELLSLEAVYRAVALELQANRKPDFSSLVSPLSPRRMAARVFYLLLVLAAQQIFRMEQEKPYGRLLIQPGPRFQCG